MRRLKKLFGKKILVGAFVGAVIVAFIVVAFTTGGRNIQDQAHANIAEARFFMRQALSEDLKVQFFSGIREQNYQMDGVADAPVPFALLNIEPRGINLIDAQELRGTLKLGEEEKQVTLERNQFGRNFGIDLGELVDAETEVTFTLDIGSANNPVFTLVHAMPEEAISWEEALDIGAKYFAEQLSGEGVTSFESYVKIITDRDAHAAFWFVQFVTSDGQNLFTVLNYDGEILERRE